MEGDEGQKKRRRNIRRMINDNDLAEETRLEQERERERIEVNFHPISHTL